MNDDELRAAFAHLLSDLPADGPLPAATARRVRRRRGLKQAAVGAGGAGALAAVVTLGLTGTAPREDRLEPPATQPSATSSASPSPQATTSTGPTGRATPTPGPSATSSLDRTPGPSAGSGTAAAAARIVLRPDGLGLSAGSSTSALPFGTPAPTVRAAVDRVLGAGGATPTPDCGAGTSTVQHETLFLVLRDDVFVGWVSGSPGLATGDGLAVGSTLAQLRDALPGVQVGAGSLGQEWSTVEGGLAGFLEGTDADLVVSSIAAGVRCLAR